MTTQGQISQETARRLVEALRRAKNYLDEEGCIHTYSHITKKDCVVCNTNYELAQAEKEMSA